MHKTTAPASHTVLLDYVSPTNIITLVRAVQNAHYSVVLPVTGGFLISLMVSSAGSTTLPVYVYGMMRLGVTPEVNAISTILLAVSLVFVSAALLLGRRYGRTE